MFTRKPFLLKDLVEIRYKNIQAIPFIPVSDVPSKVNFIRFIRRNNKNI
jgi:hypothetical protein